MICTETRPSNTWVISVKKKIGQKFPAKHLFRIKNMLSKINFDLKKMLTEITQIRAMQCKSNSHPEYINSNTKCQWSYDIYYNFIFNTNEIYALLLLRRIMTRLGHKTHFCSVSFLH